MKLVKEKKIIFSAYYCTPFLPSEAMGAFHWLCILLKKYRVILLTNDESAEGIKKYFKGKIPENLSIIIIDDTNFLKEKWKGFMHAGYFTFNRNLKKYIKRHRDELNSASLVIHKNPTSFRYPTCLNRLDVPLVIGPIGGGLQIPKILKGYFHKEPLVNKLRVLDHYWLKLPSIRRSYDKSVRLLITLDYLRDILPQKYAHKVRVFFDTGISMDKEPVINSDHEIVRILYVGRLVRYKGGELAVRAFGKVARNHKVIFDIVGEGDERDLLENIARELGCDEQVKFWGKVPYDQVEDFYKRADIFLFPSIKEASGNVLLEAMKFALPIIGINNGGAKYMCPDEGAVKITIDHPEKMIEEIATALESLISDPEKRRTMGRINHEHCRDNYSWEVLEEKIFNMIEELIDGSEQR